MSSWFEQLKNHIEQQNERIVNEQSDEEIFFQRKENECLVRKKKCLEKRGAEIVKSTVDGKILSHQQFDTQRHVEYVIHYQFLTKVKKQFYLEESIQTRKAVLEQDTVINDYLVEDEWIDELSDQIKLERDTHSDTSERFQYNRLEAVRYAERWWDSRNPEYKNFTNNCTNYISQCLRAGGIPMTGYPNRSKGWWYRDNNWSYSWSVANAFRWQLSGATKGLRGKGVSSATELNPGDVICYDFDGDGRWQHTTIVVAKDSNNEPLVNANTSNSRMRYWAYEDSTAWTPNIKYKFFQIVDD